MDLQETLFSFNHLFVFVEKKSFSFKKPQQKKYNKKMRLKKYYVI